MKILEQKQHLIDLSQHALAHAKKLGASASDVDIDIDKGLSVNARLGEVETLEHLKNRGFGISVFFGNKKGNASTSDFSIKAIEKAVEAACDIARYTSEDNCTGLAPKERMATEFPDLDIYHPWDLSAEKAIELAIECESYARDYDKRIINSEGASVNVHEGISIYANSHGFIGIQPSSQHYISCSVIAQDEKGMQRDYFYSVASDANDLKSLKTIGEQTAIRTLNRLGATKLSTRQAPIILTADLARSFWSTIVSALSGGSLYRKASFLLDSLNTQVFPTWLTIQEQPFLKKQLGSASFDHEGVATKDLTIIENGIIKTYFLSNYSACKLNMQTTGHSGGVHNLQVTGNKSLEALIKQMDKGLLVTELMGHGINLVTGDYSQGAAGFWVENGAIQYPVEEITIANNLQNLCKELVAVGNDIDVRGSIHSGSLLFENMTIAGE